MNSLSEYFTLAIDHMPFNDVNIKLTTYFYGFFTKANDGAFFAKLIGKIDSQITPTRKNYPV